MEYTVNEAKEMLVLDDVPASILDIMANDQRESVKKLLLQYYKRQLRAEKEKERVAAMYLYERSFVKRGIKPVAGTDEAGRGPLAGPVVAAAVILPEDCFIAGINDSKKISAIRREQLFEEINQRAVAVSYALVEPQLIDEINIYQASRRAMTQALSSLVVQPGAVISDAMPLPGVNYAEVLAIEKADSKSATVAAASIIAKVIRDRIMVQLDHQYPEYGFSANKGYGTAAHIEALKRYGATAQHRRTFSPVDTCKTR